ncbi:nucleoside diphosphate kinase regulator [Loktanella salsilacus]|uniref:nucleoside diphosphate kinase regulator n=1 Tax=Loktanella salsilacus TaxID=195913 RepID=UPI0020B8CFAC|nr:nucleoside diphosphate kinase regulator [Loktanella salsilacus]UTH46724.1 nucleoside diphosphate kinase regulator [Loktanella salsilacus]
MSDQLTQKMKTRVNLAPKIVIDADELSHIEALAEGAMLRNPAVADRLMDEIGRAKIVKHEKMPADVVTIGSTVRYRDGTTGKERSVTLVYPEHADISRDLISVVTPIGVALLGLTTGAAFFWDTRNNQRRTLTIIDVANPPTGATLSPDTVSL